MFLVGVGSDTKGANSIYTHKQNKDNKHIYAFPDSRKGRIDSIKLLLVYIQFKELISSILNSIILDLKVNNWDFFRSNIMNKFVYLAS